MLFLDFETRSALDVRHVGAFRYAEDPSTSIMCMGWAIDDGEPAIWVPGKDPFPGAVHAYVAKGGSLAAWNAQFESCIWPLTGEPAPRETQWVCVAALAARANLPRSLGNCADVLGLSVQKDAGGRALMLRLCRLRKDGAEATPEDIHHLHTYCQGDVAAERAVFQALPEVEHPFERALFLLDREINARGVAVDSLLVGGALRIVTGAVADINTRLRQATDGAVQSIAQVAALARWATDRGVPLTSVDRAALRTVLQPDSGIPGPVRAVLALRQEGNKSSTAKLETFQRTTQADGRVRGMLLYYGAGTGRWAGRLIQPQNFYRPTIEVSEDLLDVVASGDRPLLAAVLPPGASVLEAVVSCLRGCFVAGPGMEFTAADFAQIEARVLAWIAGADDLLAAFRAGRSPYLDMGRVIFGRSIGKKEDSFEYQVSKNTVLGCGYQMGWETFQTQALEQTGVLLPDELCQRAVAAFRQTYMQIPRLWKGINRICMEVVKDAAPDWVPVNDFLAFRIDPSGWLTMRLPSGRCLWYPSPRLSKRITPWGDQVECVTVAGVLSQTTRWGRYALYGGLLTGNAVQATARDLMGEAMLRVDLAGYPVVLTVHDEILAEHPAGHGSVKHFENLMATTPPWAEGCPVAAEGWRGRRYRK